jgi:exodeoxyribonuclease-1
MTFVLYDVETTGIRKAFDQILQFAAVRTDFELQEIATLETSARLSPQIVPSAQALGINRLDIATITDAKRLSLYNMICGLRTQLESWAPCTFLGFNSISFDEEFLRHAFYQCLFPAYLTNTPPNTRGDVLHVMRAFAAFHPEEIVVPLTDAGKRTFALRPLAMANGFPDFGAHEAMTDVRAMLHLCRLVARRAPDLWSRYQRFAQKRTVVDFIHSEPAFLYFDGTWSSATHCVALLGGNTKQSNIHYCLSLTASIDRLSALTEGELRKFVLETDGAVLRLKANCAPVLCPVDDAPSHLLDDQMKADCLESARKLRAAEGLVERLLAICNESERRFEPSRYVEAQLYEQPFWPGEDEDVIRRFHQAPWEERGAIINGLSDKRSRQMARRLIYLERPDLLPEADRDAFTQRVRRRVSEDKSDVPWLTAPAALRELAALATGKKEGDMRLARLQVYLQRLTEEM